MGYSKFYHALLDSKKVVIFVFLFNAMIYIRLSFLILSLFILSIRFFLINFFDFLDKFTYLLLVSIRKYCFFFFLKKT